MQVTLHFTRAQDSGDPYQFHFGRVEYLLHGEGHHVSTATFRWDDALLADLDGLRTPAADVDLAQRVGGRLRRFLQKAGWARSEAEIVQAVERGEPVYVSVISNAAELYALPWELLTIEASGQHLGRLPGVLFRYAWPGTTSTRYRLKAAQERSLGDVDLMQSINASAALDTQAQGEGGRILFAWSDAAGAVPAMEHQRAIADACHRGHYEFFRPQVDVGNGGDVLAQASLAKLAAVLKQADTRNRPISILHLLCHGVSEATADGEVFGLGLSDDHGGVSFVDPGTLRDFLAQPWAQQIRLVVLAACDSGNLGAMGNQLGSVAQAVHQAGLPAVIASRFPFAIPASIQFSRELYQHLLVRLHSLEQAFAAARDHLAMSGERLDWASLQLYSRGEDGDDTRPAVFRPYRGLLAFQRQHTRFFFGRGDERAETLSDLQALRDEGKPRFLVVAGASGTGKSSLVLGGAVPDLLAAQGDGHPIDGCDSDSDSDSNGNSTGDDGQSDTVQRDFAATLAQLERLRARLDIPFLHHGLEILRRGAAALGAAAESGWYCDVVRVGDDPLQTLARIHEQLDQARGRYLVIIDQFEELFTHTEDIRVRDAFCQDLWRLASADNGFHCIITIRVDFLGSCGDVIVDEASGLRLDKVAYDESHRIFVAQMATEQLRSAIVEPARQVGLALQEGLVEHILDEVGAELGSLPLVQYALDLLWQRREGRTLTLGAYEAMGGVVGALQTKADGIIDSLDETGQQLARYILVRLVRLGNAEAADTRRRVAVATLEPRDPAERIEFRAVVEALVSARLLVRSGDGNAATLEVAHEALIRKWQRLRKWMEEDRIKLGQLQQIEDWVTEWKEHDRADADLLNHRKLLQALDMREHFAGELGADALELIARSEAREQANRRRARRRQIFAAAAVAVMSVLTVVSVYAYSNAKESEALAKESEALAVAAKERAEAAQNTAERARSEADTARGQAVRSQGQARNASRLAASRVDSDPVTGAVLLPEVAGGDSEANVMPYGWAQAAVDTLNQPIARRVFSAPHGHRFLAMSDDGNTMVGVHGNRDDALLLFAKAKHDEAGGSSRDEWEIQEFLPHEDDRNRPGAGTCGIGGQYSLVGAHLNADGTRALAWHEYGIIRIWDVGRRTLLFCARPDGAINAVALDRAGLQFAVATHEQDSGVRVQLWQIPAVTTQAPAGASGDALGAGAPLADEPYKYSRIERKRKRRGRGAAGGQDEDGGHGRYTAMAFSHAGKQLAVGGVDGRIRVWSLRGFAKVLGQGKLLKRHTAEITALAFSADDERLLAGARDRKVSIWQLKNWRKPQLLPHRRQVVAVLADGDDIITSTSDGMVRIWHRGMDRQPTVYRGHEHAVERMHVDGSDTLRTMDSDGQVRFWPRHGADNTQLLSAHRAAVDGVVFIDDQRALSASRDGMVCLWQKGMCDRRKAAGRDTLSAMAVNGDGGWAVTASWRELWALPLGPSGRRLLLKGHRGVVKSVAFHPGDNRLISADLKGELRLWNLDAAASSREAPVRVLRHGAAVYHVAFDHSGGRFLTIARDGDSFRHVHIWDSDKGQRVLTLGEEHPAMIQVAEFVPPRRGQTGDAHTWQIMTGAADGTVRLWTIRDNEVKVGCELSGHRAEVLSLSFSRNGAYAVTGSADESARIWHMERGCNQPDESENSARPKVLEGHYDSVVAAQFFAGDKYIATASYDGTVRMWNAARRDIPLLLASYESAVISLAASPSGEFLIAGGLDGAVRRIRADRDPNELRDRLRQQTSAELGEEKRQRLLGEERRKESGAGGPKTGDRSGKDGHHNGTPLMAPFSPNR